jgi:hypothetical protein
MAEYDLGGGVTVEHPDKLFARGTILRGQFADLKSPIAYGYDNKDLPVYFNQDPVLMPAAGGGGFGGRGGGGGRGAALAEEGVGMNITPNSNMLNIQPLDPDSAPPAAAPAAGGRGGRGAGRGGRAGVDAAGAGGAPAGAAAANGGGRGGRGGRGGGIPEDRARVIMSFPSDASKMLLSGTLAGGEALANRALAVDVPLGKGHIVLFALRPFWRWQSQGTYFLAFNAINNWDHLDAGKPAPGQGAAATPGN